MNNFYGLVYIVSPFPEHNYWSYGTGFQKLFSNVYSARVILLSHTGLSDSGSHKQSLRKLSTPSWWQSHEAEFTYYALFIFLYFCNLGDV